MTTLRIYRSTFDHMLIVFGIHPVEESEEYHCNEVYLPMNVAHTEASIL